MGGLSRRKIHQSGPTTTIAFHPWVSSGSQALVGGTTLSKAMRQPVSVKWTFAALILASLVSGPIEVKAIGAEDGFSEDLNDKAYGYANTGVSADSTLAEDAIYNAREMRAPASRAFLRSLRSPPGQGGSMHFLRSLRGHPSGTNMHFLRSLRSGDGSHFIRALKSGRHFFEVPSERPSVDQPPLLEVSQGPRGSRRRHFDRGCLSQDNEVSTLSEELTERGTTE